MLKKLLCGLLPLLTCLPAHASDTPTLGVDLSTALQYTDMHEMVNGNTVVTETGWLPGASAGFFRDQGSLRLKASVEGFGGFFSHGLNYDGRLQGSGQPYQTTTDTQYAGAQLSASWRQDGWESTVFGGYHYWHRNVNGDGQLGVGSTIENYRWYQLGLGVSHRFNLQNRVFLQPQMDVFYNLRINQSATSPGFDTARLHPGANQGLRLGVLIGQQTNALTTIGLRPYWQMYQFDRSTDVEASLNGAPTDSFLFQPLERFRQFGLSLEVESRFR